MIMPKLEESYQGSLQERANELDDLNALVAFLQEHEAELEALPEGTSMTIWGSGRPDLSVYTVKDHFHEVVKVFEALIGKVFEVKFNEYTGDMYVYEWVYTAPFPLNRSVTISIMGPVDSSCAIQKTKKTQEREYYELVSRGCL